MDGKRALLSLFAAAVIACGGAAPATSGGATSPATTAAGAATATAASTAAGGGAATPAATGPRFAELLGAAKLSQYKVTYKISATGQGAEAMAGEQTWYFKPPKARFDFASSFGGQRMTMSVYTLPDGTFYCVAMGGAPQCFAAGSGGIGSPLDSNAAAQTQQQMLANPGQFGATFKESKTIAGQAGHCYTVTGTAATFSNGTFCYTREGIALLSQFAASGSTIAMEATNVATTVPDSDFELPAKPIGR